MSYVFIMLGGAAGTLARYFVSGFVGKSLEGAFPWGTLAVNLAGCLLIGILWELFESKAIAPGARVFIFTGFLGGFTTFSTFGLEAASLMRGATPN
ncbi:MAG: fluoride efflux transporter CrcB [Deltaproteobacteria bacterium]